MAALTKFDIAGKHAIVTGGAQGLSRGMAEGLLEAGCKVVIIDVQKEKVEKVCEEYPRQGSWKPTLSSAIWLTVLT